MKMTDKHLISVKLHPILSGTIRRYMLGKDEWSFVNAKIMHEFKFAWEAMNLHTEEIRIFSSNEKANSFIERF